MAHTRGVDLETRCHVPSESELYSMVRQLKDHRMDALLMVGEYHAYTSVDLTGREHRRYPAFNIPVAVVPASISNNPPGWMMTVGAGTALNTVVDAIDILRISALASKRAFIVETMGRDYGFLPLVDDLAEGAGKTYLPETRITPAELETDAKALVDTSDSGRNFYLAMVREGISECYTTDVLGKFYEAEGNGRFSVRGSVVGHLQQGGTPSPFNHINATRLAWNATGCLDRQLRVYRFEYTAACAGAEGLFAPLHDMTDGMDRENMRPHTQWWHSLHKPFDILSRRPGQK